MWGRRQEAGACGAMGELYVFVLLLHLYLIQAPPPSPVVQELKMLMPLIHPEIFNTTLLKQSTGVLLYGPPGTGKTMLAKALARGSDCYFLNLTTSTILSKWLGDANKMVRAVFSLAAKLPPCIIFIGEWVPVGWGGGWGGCRQDGPCTLLLGS